MSGQQDRAQVSIFSNSPDRPATAALMGGAWWGVFGESGFPSEFLIGRSSLLADWSHSSPGLIVSDVDSTLIDEEVIDQLADLAGVGAEVAAVTDLAMSGQIDFETSLRKRVARLRGLSSESLLDVYRGLRVRNGATDLIKWIHNSGGRFGVVSGGFSQIVGWLAEDLHLDYYRANELEIVDGKLTGQVVGPVVTAATKAQCLAKWSAENPGWTIALGDGANDIPLLQTADLGIAICAKQLVKDVIPNYLDSPQLDAVIGLAGRSTK